MSFEFDAPETTESGRFLREAGTFHFAVTAVDEQPASRKGELLDGFRVEANVLDGTARANGHCSETDRVAEIMFFHPSLTAKNEGLFARQKQAKFLKLLSQLPY